MVVNEILAFRLIKNSEFRSRSLVYLQMKMSCTRLDFFFCQNNSCGTVCIFARYLEVMPLFLTVEFLSVDKAFIFFLHL